MDIKFSMALLEPLSQLFHICYQSKVNWTLLYSLLLSRSLFSYANNFKLAAGDYYLSISLQSRNLNTYTLYTYCIYL